MKITQESFDSFQSEYTIRLHKMGLNTQKKFFVLETPREVSNFTCSQSDQRTCFSMVCVYVEASLVAQLVKNPPAVLETPVQFLGQEDPLEKR